jgi:hypothetical protein
MHHWRKNHCHKALVVAALLIASLAAAFLGLSGKAAAERGDRMYDIAWACSTLYSRAPIKVLNSDDRETALCQGEGKGGRKPMSRSEAWELCREQFDTINQFLDWTSKGWRCRYYGQ